MAHNRSASFTETPEDATCPATDERCWQDGYLRNSGVPVVFCCLYKDKQFNLVCQDIFGLIFDGLVILSFFGPLLVVTSDITTLVGVCSEYTAATQAQWTFGSYHR